MTNEQRAYLKALTREKAWKMAQFKEHNVYAVERPTRAWAKAAVADLLDFQPRWERQTYGAKP